MVRNTFMQDFSTCRPILNNSRRMLLLASSILLAACTTSTAQVSNGKAATATTIAANAKSVSQLDLDDPQDFKDATRGLIASPENIQIPSMADPQEYVWDTKAYNFIQGEAPDSVNPSLWRQAKLNNIKGLFEFRPGIYQLRGFDLSNMTLIKGDTGWIVIDPLTSKETAKYAYDFAMKHLANRYPDMSSNISAVVFTHSHIDHFGGALGILSQEDIEKNNIPIIAPSGFMEEATSENILAGTAMLRRSSYMYGKNLPRNEYGHIDSGLGKGPAFGQFSIIEPNILVGKTPTNLNVDGVDFQFQYTPGSEAPAEFTFYLPEYKVLSGAELVSRNMHNLYTLRGAKVRDALKWSNYIEEARTQFGDAEYYFASHHWPMWGKDSIQNFLKQQRDTYKFIHDQSLRRINKGMTPGEIAEDITLPPSLASEFSNREYYGTIKHNARAVYQNYIGWYDANPAHLDPLPDPQRASAYVKLAGGGSKVMEQAQTSYDEGNYRWAAEILNHLVFDDPSNMAARELLAKTYDQLGYQAESGPWRDSYLTGAKELREGTPDAGVEMSAMRDVFLQTPVSNFFDALSVRLKSEEANGLNTNLKVHFTDKNESYLLWIENSVLHYRLIDSTEATQKAVQTTLNLTHPLFVDLLIGKVTFKDMLSSADSKIEGNQANLITFFSLFEAPDPSFAIVLPD